MRRANSTTYRIDHLNKQTCDLSHPSLSRVGALVVAELCQSYGNCAYRYSPVVKLQNNS